MKSIKRSTLSTLLLLVSILSLSAQMETNLKTLSDFYHVPDYVTHRLSKVTGIFDYEDFEYIYNSHNDLARFNHYQTDESSGIRSLVTFEEYHYNDKKQCIEIVNYSGRSGFDELVIAWREVFTYNDKGQMTNYTRWGNHNTNPDDTTLVKDQKLVVQYTEDGLPDKANVEFLDPNNFQFYPSFEFTFEYDDRRRLHKRIASLAPGSIEELEELILDENGALDILSLTDSHQEVTEWQYTYDEKGNLSTLGTPGFIYEYEFVSGQAAAKTYYPRYNLAKVIIYGIRNYGVYLSIPLLYNGSKEAVARHVTNGGIFHYEQNEPLGIEPLATPSHSKLRSDATAWTLTDASSVVALYDLTGICLQVFEPAGGIVIINKEIVPSGSYIIQSGSQTFKVIR